MITYGKGKYKVWLKHERVGDDLLFILGGGEQSHIGGMVVCEPEKTPQVFRLEHHYDYVVLEPLAQAACQKYKKKVVVVGGIHIENATKEEIQQVVKNCQILGNSL